MVPVAGAIDQVTPVEVAPVTVAVNVCPCDGSMVAAVGVTETVTAEVMVTLAEADSVGSAPLVAVTVTVWEPEIEAGAVYRPAEEMAPTDGLIAHVTAFLTRPRLLPETVVVNCCVPEGAKLTVDGLMDTVLA